jgi:hypothetical protein
VELTGNFSTTPFRDLLAILSSKFDSGVLHIRYQHYREYEGRVVIYQSKLYSAWISRRTPVGRSICYYGKDALQILVNLPEADFFYQETTPQLPPHTPNLFYDNLHNLFSEPITTNSLV